MHVCTFNSYYAVHQFKAGHWNTKYQWEFVTKQHALQRDGSSCGVYVMKVRFIVPNLISVS